jgi:hypothetical protein
MAVIFYKIDKLTISSRMLFEKLKVPHLVKNLVIIYGIQRFITAFTKSSHLYLS